MRAGVEPAPSLRGALAAGGVFDPPEGLDALFDRVTPEAVERELARPPAPFRIERLVTLLSPAALPHLEAMAQQAHALTVQRFGRVIQLYVPLYLSSHCINRCRYCAFHAGSPAERTRLSLDEACREAEILAAQGFRDLLLVSGEDPEFVTLDYLAELAGRIKSRFSSLSIEIYPLDAEGYRRLFAAGVDGVTIYQETYDPALYARFHPGGPKAIFDARLSAQEAAASAGMRRLGIGVLLGLGDWRREALALALHARHLMRRHWQARVSFSFPRLQPARGAVFEGTEPVTDRELVQMMLALRLCFPDAGLALSTREGAELRDRLLPLGVTQLSAGSRTSPGGYGAPGGTGQFEVADERTAAAVAAQLRAAGYEPVWKDWDTGFEPLRG